jgi:outer membrane protein assembly factor BamB
MPNKLSLATAAAVCLLHVPSPPSARADDWPDWRGAKRDGIWRETGILRRFPAGGPKVLWRAPIGPGYTGPSVAGGRVFAMDRIREREVERVIAYDAADGKTLWTDEYPARYKGVDYDSGPRATPVAAEGRVHTLGTMGHLRTYDAAAGRVIWSKDLKAEYRAAIPGWGISAAPLADGKLLIVPVGGEGGPALIAFDRATGDEVWRALGEEDPPAYSAPVIVEAGGARQLIYWSAKSVCSLDPLTGKLHWREPFVSKSGMAVATPTLHGDVLFVSTFFSGALALRLDPTRPAASGLYRSSKTSEMDTDIVHCTISTPSFSGKHLYAVDSYGEFRCVEVETGKRIWETLAPTGKARWSNAHIVPNGDVTFLFNEHGDLIVADLSPEGYREIDRARIIEATVGVKGHRAVAWSHPAFALRSVFARNDREIIRVDLSAGAPPEEK